MRKAKELNDAVREFNGLMARTKKAPTTENKSLLDESLARLAEKAQELLIDQTKR